MKIIKVIIIAIIQGLTEFLPVSSSGHIFLLKNITNLEFSIIFDLTLHLGTLMSVFVYFRKEIYELLTGPFKNTVISKNFSVELSKKDYFKLWIFFIISTIPGALAGWKLSDFLDFEPSNTPKWMFLLLGIFFFITACLLFLTTFFKKQDKNVKNMNFLHALIIGIFQAFGVLPGVSRSGSTISGALYTGLNKKDAAKYSFILSIPIILGAFVFELLKLIKSVKIDEIITNDILLMALGFIISFIVGLIVLKYCIKIIEKGKLWVFAIYLIIPIAVSIFLYIKK